MSNSEGKRRQCRAPVGSYIKKLYRRCHRLSQENGFCYQHQEDAAEERIALYARVVASAQEYVKVREEIGPNATETRDVYQVLKAAVEELGG